MKMNMRTGARMDTMNWGRYVPKNTSRVSTPSAKVSITVPVRF